MQDIKQRQPLRLLTLDRQIKNAARVNMFVSTNGGTYGQ